MLSFTIWQELINRPPGVPLIALAVPGYPIPLIDVPILFPIVWPDETPVVQPPNMESVSTYGGSQPPNVALLPISGGQDQAVEKANWNLQIGEKTVGFIIGLRVNWLVRARRMGRWQNRGCCPVLEAIRDDLARRVPVTIAVSTPIAVSILGLHQIVVTTMREWPSAGICKPCPVLGSPEYARVRRMVQGIMDLPGVDYITIARKTGLIQCVLTVDRQDAFTQTTSSIRGGF